MQCGTSGETIGIIAPYRAQVALLRKTVTCDIVEVNTVDQYQGRDKDVIIFSCTKSVSSDSAANVKVSNPDADHIYCAQDCNTRGELRILQIRGHSLIT